MSQKFLVLIGILSGALGASIIWGVQTLMHQEPPRIAVLNVRALVDEEILRVAKLNITDEKAAEQVKATGKRLSQLAEMLARAEGLVLLPETAVIAGGMDITNQIKERLQHGPRS